VDSVCSASPCGVRGQCGAGAAYLPPLARTIVNLGAGRRPLTAVDLEQPERHPGVRVHGVQHLPGLEAHLRRRGVERIMG
jgi:hypothetical protein